MDRIAIVSWSLIESVWLIMLPDRMTKILTSQGMTMYLWDH